MTRSRPPRLTDVEWSALTSAAVIAEGQWEDEDDPVLGGPEGRRNIEAVDRALRKIEAHLRPRARPTATR